MTQDEADTLIASWKAKFGDPNDPKVKEQIDATVRAIEERMKNKQLTVVKAD